MHWFHVRSRPTNPLSEKPAHSVITSQTIACLKRRRITRSLPSIVRPNTWNVRATPNNRRFRVSETRNRRIGRPSCDFSVGQSSDVPKRPPEWEWARCESIEWTLFRWYLRDLEKNKIFNLRSDNKEFDPFVMVECLYTDTFYHICLVSATCRELESERTDNGRAALSLRRHGWHQYNACI